MKLPNKDDVVLVAVLIALAVLNYAWVFQLIWRNL